MSLVEFLENPECSGEQEEDPDNEQQPQAEASEHIDDTSEKFLHRLGKGATMTEGGDLPCDCAREKKRDRHEDASQKDS